MNRRLYRGFERLIALCIHLNEAAKDKPEGRITLPASVFFSISYKLNVIIQPPPICRYQSYANSTGNGVAVSALTSNPGVPGAIICISRKAVFFEEIQ